LNSETTKQINAKYEKSKPNNVNKNILGTAPIGKVFCILIILPNVFAVYVIGIFLMVKVSRSSLMIGRGSTLGWKDSVLVENNDYSSIKREDYFIC